MFTIDVQHRGGSVLLSVSGELDEHAGTTLRQSYDHAAATHARDLMVDLHNVTFMNPAGLFHLLDLHRRAEIVGLRVLVIGWQPQPRRLMATVAGVIGADPTAAHRYCLADFRRLISQRTWNNRPAPSPIHDATHNPHPLEAGTLLPEHVSRT